MPFCNSDFEVSPLLPKFNSSLLPSNAAIPRDPATKFIAPHASDTVFIDVAMISCRSATERRRNLRPLPRRRRRSHGRHRSHRHDAGASSLSEINIWDESEAAPRGLATMQKYPIWSSDRRARREIGREVADKEAQLARALHARADRVEAAAACAGSASVNRSNRDARRNTLAPSGPPGDGSSDDARRWLALPPPLLASYKPPPLAPPPPRPPPSCARTYAWPWGGGPDRITGTSSSSGKRARAASAEQQHAPFRSARSVARRDIRRSMHEPYEGLRLTVRPIRVRDICSPVSPRVAPPQVWSLLGHNHPTARRAEGYCSFFATAVVRRVTFSIGVPPRSRWPLRAAPPPSDHWHAQATFANGETVLSPAAQAELLFVRRDDPRPIPDLPGIGTGDLRICCESTALAT